MGNLTEFVRSKGRFTMVYKAMVVLVFLLALILLPLQMEGVEAIASAIVLTIWAVALWFLGPEEGQEPDNGYTMEV